MDEYLKGIMERGVAALPKVEIGSHGIGPKLWTPEQRGRACHMIHVLANTPPQEWRTKRELHEALAEFRHKRT